MKLRFVWMLTNVRLPKVSVMKRLCVGTSRMNMNVTVRKATLAMVKPVFEEDARTLTVLYLTLKNAYRSEATFGNVQRGMNSTTRLFVSMSTSVIMNLVIRMQIVRINPATLAALVVLAIREMESHALDGKLCLY